MFRSGILDLRAGGNLGLACDTAKKERTAMNKRQQLLFVNWKINHIVNWKILFSTMKEQLLNNTYEERTKLQIRYLRKISLKKDEGYARQPQQKNQVCHDTLRW